MRFKNCKHANFKCFARAFAREHEAGMQVSLKILTIEIIIQIRDGLAQDSILNRLSMQDMYYYIFLYYRD